MDLHELPFAKIIILREDIAEVLINEGVEMDIKAVNHFHDFLLSHMRHPFSLLINKINHYSYDFAAQSKLGALKESSAIAVVAYSRITEISTESVASFPRDVKWNMKIFSNRDEALSWLESENNESNKTH